MRFFKTKTPEVSEEDAAAAERLRRITARPEPYVSSDPGPKKPLAIEAQPRVFWTPAELKNAGQP